MNLWICELASYWILQNSWYSPPNNVCMYTIKNDITKRKNHHIFKVAYALVLCIFLNVYRLRLSWLLLFLSIECLIVLWTIRDPVEKTLFHYTFWLNPCPKVFGYVYYIYIHELYTNKLDPRVFKFVFLKYSNAQKGYKFFHPPTVKYYVTIHVKFCEHVIFLYRHLSSFSSQGD